VRWYLRFKLSLRDLVETLADAMISRGTPGYIRSDNGPEFVARTLRRWIAEVGTQTATLHRKIRNLQLERHRRRRQS
jgi:transposase-like protein